MQGSPGTHRDLPFRTVPLKPPRAAHETARGTTPAPSPPRDNRLARTVPHDRFRSRPGPPLARRYAIGNPMAPEHCQNVRMIVSVRPLRPPMAAAARHIATIQARLPERPMAHRDHHVGPGQHLSGVACALPRPTAGGTPGAHGCPASLGKSAGRVPARLHSSFPAIQLQDERGFHRGCQ